MKPAMTALFIDRQESLSRLCEQLSGSEFIAVDTEFMREHTYFPQLALIQLGNGEVTACIDPLAIQDFGPLKALLIDPNITKVFHAAGQDMEVFYYLFGELPTPVYDTQVAATLQGLGDQIGYANLVQEMLGVELDKSHTRTNWLQRPLSDCQIRYAEDDARYLAQIYPMQRRQLEQQGRLEWLDDDFQQISDPARFRPDLNTLWHRIKGNNKLKGVQLAILQKLAAWREQRAMDRDIPRRRAAADNVLLDIARLRPKNIQALGRIRGIPESLVNKHGKTLLQCVADAENSDRATWPQLNRPKRLDAKQDALVDVLSAIIKLNAWQHQINFSTLTNRKDLENMVRGERDLPILQGWRLHHGGEQLISFLNGENSLQIVNHHLTLTSNPHKQN